MNAPFDQRFYQVLAEAEDRHFWFRGRRNIVAALLGQVVRDFPPNYRVLEVGCGTGYMTRMLQQICSMGTVFGMDVYPSGLLHASRRSAAHFVAGDLRQPPFSCKFQLVALFDVLEHIPDDTAALENIQELLGPGGQLILTVPAHPELWSYFDVASCHQRRYRLKELKNQLEYSGFEVLYATEFLRPLYTLLKLKRRVLRKEALRATSRDLEAAHKAAARELRVVPILNPLMSWWLSREARLVSVRKQIRCGSSILALLRKRRP